LASGVGFNIFETMLNQDFKTDRDLILVTLNCLVSLFERRR